MPIKYVALHRCRCRQQIAALNERAGSPWFLVWLFGTMATSGVNKLMHGTVDVKEGRRVDGGKSRMTLQALSATRILNSVAQILNKQAQILHL